MTALFNARVRIATILLFLSLGLPWSNTSHLGITSVIPGYYVAGLCRTVQTWDGWYEMQCDPGIVGAPIYNYGYTDHIRYGAQHPGRFGVALGLLLIFLAHQLKRPRYLLIAGLCVAGFNVLTAGLSFGFAGSSIAWFASLLLISCCLKRITTMNQSTSKTN